MELEVKDFDELYCYRLKKTKKPTAIMFKANFCGHCKRMAPVWKRVKKQLLFMNVYTFTIDDTPEKAEHFDKLNDSLEEGHIVGFPTFLFYKEGGEEISKLEGSGYTFEDFLQKGKEIAE